MPSWLFAFGVLLSVQQAIFKGVNIQLDRVEQVSGFEYVNATGLRVRKYNRSTYIVEGQAEAFQDFDNEYWFTLTCAHSRLGNQQFNEYPMKIPRMRACDVLNGPYKEYSSYFIEYTNLPRVGNDWFCPFPKGVYWVREFAPSGDWVPLVVPDGYWKMTVDVLNPKLEPIIRLVWYQKNEHVMGLK